MTVKLELSQDEVRKLIPYELICETMESSIWDTQKRKRMMEDGWFTLSEKNKLKRIKDTAHRWALVSGIPSSGISMTSTELMFWQRLGTFCSILARGGE